MREVVLTALFALSMAVAMHGQRAPGSEAERSEAKQQILKLEDERDQALMNNDADWFERVFADDMTFNGKPSKAQVVAEIRSKDRKWQAVRHDEYRVRIYGNTAVVVYRSDSTMDYKGKVSTNLATTTDVYVKQNGVWRAVVHDVTPIKQ